MRIGIIGRKSTSSEAGWKIFYLFIIAYLGKRGKIRRRYVSGMQGNFENAKDS